MGVIRYLPYIVVLGLLVYALIDCIQTDPVVVRNLPKLFWVWLIILLPLVGSVAWLVAGRPEGAQRPRPVPWPSTATAGFPEYERPRPPRGPDDDDAFLSGLGPDPEKERLLALWEAQLREREARLRDAAPEAPQPDESGAQPALGDDA